MKALICVDQGFYVVQELVEVEKVIFYKEHMLVLHRPHKESRNRYDLWVVSDAASGARISQSTSEKLAIKMAKKRLKMHKKHFIKARKEILQNKIFA